MQTKTVNSSLPFIKVEFLFLARLKPDLPIFGNSFQYLLLVAVAEAVVLLVPKGRLLLKKAGKNNKTDFASRRFFNNKSKLKNSRAMHPLNQGKK